MDSCPGCCTARPILLSHSDPTLEPLIEPTGDGRPCHGDPPPGRERVTAVSPEFETFRPSSGARVARNHLQRHSRALSAGVLMVARPLRARSACSSKRWWCVPAWFSQVSRSTGCKSTLHTRSLRRARPVDRHRKPECTADTIGDVISGQFFEPRTGS
jgi:hypothetical protein